MRIALRVLAGLLLAGGMAAGWANGGGGMSMPTPPPMPREQTPQQKARDAYNDGVHDVKKADKAQAAAAEATDAGKKDKAAHEARDRYTQALRKFQEDGVPAHTEPATVPHWVRGEERAELLHAEGVAALKLAVTAFGGSPGTPPEGIEGDVVEVHTLAEVQASAIRLIRAATSMPHATASPCRTWPKPMTRSSAWPTVCP